MSKKLNLLFFRDINNYLKNENFEYLAVKKDVYWDIKPLPLTFNGYSSILKDYMAYNYDNLSDLHKELYKNNYKSFAHLENNNYKEDVKIYNIKKNL